MVQEAFVRVLRNERADDEEFRRLRDEGMRAFRDFDQAQESGQAAVASSKQVEALAKLTGAMDLFERLLADQRGPDGSLPGSTNATRRS